MRARHPRCMVYRVESAGLSCLGSAEPSPAGVPPGGRPELLELVESGAVDPTYVLTQMEPMMSALDAYKAFDTRSPGWIKVELEPALVAV